MRKLRNLIFPRWAEWTRRERLALLCILPATVVADMLLWVLMRATHHLRHDWTFYLINGIAYGAVLTIIPGWVSKWYAGR